MTERIRIEGERVTIRPLRMEEFESSYEERLRADPTTQPIIPDRDALRDRFERSGIMRDGAVDLAIEVEGGKVGEIQTFVPPNRALPPDTYEVGIIVDEALRGLGIGTEAVRLFVGWLFSEKGARQVDMPTVPTNVAMRTVLERLGFVSQGTKHELGLDFLFYVATPESWRG